MKSIHKPGLYASVFLIIVALYGIASQTNPARVLGAGYPKEVGPNFVQACTNQCLQSSSSKPQLRHLFEQYCQPTCSCSFQNIQANLTFEEFTTWNKAVAAKQAVPPAIKNKVDSAMQKCKPGAQ